MSRQAGAKLSDQRQEAYCKYQKSLTDIVEKYSSYNNFSGDVFTDRGKYIYDEEFAGPCRGDDAPAASAPTEFNELHQSRMNKSFDAPRDVITDLFEMEHQNTLSRNGSGSESFSRDYCVREVERKIDSVEVNGEKISSPTGNVKSKSNVRTKKRKTKCSYYDANSDQKLKALTCCVRVLRTDFSGTSPGTKNSSRNLNFAAQGNETKVSDETNNPALPSSNHGVKEYEEEEVLLIRSKCFPDMPLLLGQAVTKKGQHTLTTPNYSSGSKVDKGYKSFAYRESDCFFKKRKLL